MASAVEGAETTALVAASRDVVKHYRGRYAAPWNYRAEDPRNDVRGFHVEKLSQDATDAQFDRPADRVNSPTEDRCDRVLENGARFYNDHGHPEYATPECADLRSLVAHDKAGERIVWQAARAYAAETGKQVGIFKNNTDFHGASYGTHESYVLRRSVPWDDVVRSFGAVFSHAHYLCGRRQSRHRRTRRRVVQLSNFAARRFFQRAAKRGHIGEPAARQHAR